MRFQIDNEHALRELSTSLMGSGEEQMPPHLQLLYDMLSSGDADHASQEKQVCFLHCRMPAVGRPFGTV